MEEWEDPACYECGLPMSPGKSNGFWFCSNCGVDTEKSFDQAVMDGFSLGIDVLGVLRGEENG